MSATTDELNSKASELSTLLSSHSSQMNTLSTAITAKETELTRIRAELEMGTTTEDLEKLRLVLGKKEEEIALAGIQMATFTSAHNDQAAKSTEKITTLEDIRFKLEEKLSGAIIEKEETSKSLLTLSARVVDLEAELCVKSLNYDDLSTGTAIEIEGLKLEISKLEASALLESTPIRSYDDSEVEAIHASSLILEENVVALTEEIEILKKVAEEDNEALALSIVKGEELETLKLEMMNRLAELESIRDDGDRLGKETLELRETLLATEQQVMELEDNLRVNGIAFDELEIKNAGLKSNLVEMEENLLESLSTTEALQEKTRVLEAIKEEKEDSIRVIEGLELKIAGFELAMSEKRGELVELSNRISQIGAEKNLLEMEMGEKLSKENEQIERTKVLAKALQSELQQSSKKLEETERLLAEVQQELELTKVQPLSIPISLPSNTASIQHVVLVSRLREERDDLEGQLEFLRTETRIRSVSSEQSLISLQVAHTEEKARLMMNIQSQGLVLQEGKQKIEELEISLEAAENKVEELMGMAMDAEELAKQYDALIEKVRSLEHELKLRVVDSDEVSFLSST